LLVQIRRSWFQSFVSTTGTHQRPARPTSSVQPTRSSPASRDKPQSSLDHLARDDQLSALHRRTHLSLRDLERREFARSCRRKP
jgi:hypothetical protein